MEPVKSDASITSNFSEGKMKPLSARERKIHEERIEREEESIRRSISPGCGNSTVHWVNCINESSFGRVPVQIVPPVLRPAQLQAEAANRAVVGKKSQPGSSNRSSVAPPPGPPPTCKLERDASDASSRISAGQQTQTSMVSSLNRSASCYYLDEAPQRAFVINTRRLIVTQKVLNSIHELIRSTAIAALTLVAAGTSRQFTSSTRFLISMLVLSLMHNNRWDRIDVNDLKDLLPLLSEDEEHVRSVPVHNPNRFLKAMSFTASPLWNWIWRLLNLYFLVTIIWGWLVVNRHWWHMEVHGENPMTDIIDQWVQDAVKDAEDGTVLGMQVLVASLMLGLHATFELVYCHEMCSVMPLTNEGKVWDPRKLGLPCRFKLFGLPSMWFTSEEVLLDLTLWVESVYPSSRVSQIYPQELALYALSGEDERRSLQDTLKHAKLFDGKCRTYVGLEKGEQPRSLQIELCFFDCQFKRSNCDYIGEFLQLGDAEDSPMEVRSSSRISPEIMV